MSRNIPPLSKDRHPIRRSRSRDVEKRKVLEDRPERSYRDSLPNYMDTSELNDNSSITHLKIKKHFT